MGVCAACATMRPPIERSGVYYLSKSYSLFIYQNALTCLIASDEGIGCTVFNYAVKRVFLYWRLFIPILRATLCTTTVFAAANIGSNVTLRMAIQHSLDQLPVDLVYSPSRIAVAPIPARELLYN